MDILGKYARDRRSARASTDAYVSAAEAIDDLRMGASLAVKLSTLGAAFDRQLCSRNVKLISDHLSDLGVGLEIDMEGRSLVEYTLRTALEVKAGPQVTLALQAYLDRTPEDLETALSHGIRPRLVKGAYTGDTSDFHEIRGRLESLLDNVASKGGAFSVGTHDGQVIDWVLDRTKGTEDIVEFGFLKGLADETKLEMVKKGRRVCEYVPFGRESSAYVARRLVYLSQLRKIGLEPLS